MMTRKMFFITVAGMFFILSGCAGRQYYYNTQRGAISGAAIGAIIGQAVGHDTAGTLTGAAIGAAAGGLLGLDADVQQNWETSPEYYQLRQRRLEQIDQSLSR
jgi:uncharacterized protein YcfJ